MNILASFNPFTVTCMNDHKAALDLPKLPVFLVRVV